MHEVLSNEIRSSSSGVFPLISRDGENTRAHAQTLPPQLIELTLSVRVAIRFRDLVIRPTEDRATKFIASPSHDAVQSHSQHRFAEN